MLINLSDLIVKKEIIINEDFDLSSENISSLGVKEIQKVSFNGKLFYNFTDEIELTGMLNAKLIMSDAIDLSDISYEIDVKIEEIITNFKNTLDINEILWENIVLEVPMRVTNKDLEASSGNGWKVKSDEPSDEIDPRLAKLQELYKGGE